LLLDPINVGSAVLPRCCHLSNPRPNLSDTRYLASESLLASVVFARNFSFFVFNFGDACCWSRCAWAAPPCRVLGHKKIESSVDLVVSATLHEPATFRGVERPLLRVGGPISYEARPSRCSSPRKAFAAGPGAHGLRPDAALHRRPHPANAHRD
jgi:hypothetical protein